MSNNTKLKLNTYFLGIALLVVGTLFAGSISGGILKSASYIGISADEQLAWLRDGLTWIAIIVIVAGTTVFMNDMTCELGSNVDFLLLWALTIACMTVIGNLVMRATPFAISDGFTVAISLLTIAFIKRNDLIGLIKRST